MAKSDRGFGWALFWLSFGAGGVVAVLAAPGLAVWSMNLLVVAGGIGFSLAAYYLGWYHPPGRIGAIGVLPRVILVQLIIWACMFWLGSYALPKPHIVEQLPGFAGHLVIKLSDEPKSQRQYVFDVADMEGSRASFYVSPSNHFTFTVTDTRGETYPLEVEIGARGIPLGEFSYIVCEVGTTTADTNMAVLVNGREVAYRTMHGAIDLGTRKWASSGSIGANQNGNNGATFVLSEMMLYSNTQTPEEMNQMADYLFNRYAIKIEHVD